MRRVDPASSGRCSAISRVAAAGGLTAALLMAVAAGHPVAAQSPVASPQAASSPGEEPVRRWSRAGTGPVDAIGESLHLRGDASIVRSQRLYSDVILRFDFRADEGSEAYVWVRSFFGADGVRGYNVLLADPRSNRLRLGAVAGVGTDRRVPRAAGGTTPPPLDTFAPNVWHTAEVRVAANRVTVRIDGRHTGTAEDLDGFTGHIGFSTVSGHLEVRNVTASSIPEWPGAFAAFGPKPADVSYPVPVRKVNPEYTREALARRVSGIVVLQAIVESDGRLGPVRVKTPLDPDLDEMAIAAARQWRFEPAMRNGAAVPLPVEIEMLFRADAPPAIP